MNKYMRIGMKEAFLKIWCSRLFWAILSGINFAGVVQGSVLSGIGLACGLYLVYSPPTGFFGWK